MIGDYPAQLDEIGQWLFDSFGILPGACSSIENLRHTTARMVAEALWPKKNLTLTRQDIRYIFSLIEALMCEQGKPAVPGDKEFCEEVLRRFNEQRRED